MTETLGKLNKPEVADFELGRKLILVPLIFLPLYDDDTELISLVKQYWTEASEQVNKLASAFIGITKVYHELVPAGDAGLTTMANMRIGSHDLVKNTVERGAVLAEIENPDTLVEFLDWGRCLSLRLESPKVFGEVYNNYSQAQQARNEAISQKIDESLKNDELGLVLLREEHGVQFPPDIQIFYVAPPILDTLTRYLRDQMNKPPPSPETPTDET